VTDGLATLRWDEAEGGRVDVAELCRVFGVSRQRGYVWLRRYGEAGFDARALEDRSRRPHTSPTAIPAREFPGASAMASILKRHGLTAVRRQRWRRRSPAPAELFGPATAPNAVWCIDFKGKLKTGDGEWCTPFTVTDAYSRFCIRSELVEEPDALAVEHILDSAFREFGLPAAIRSDNGPPFAAPGPAGLTRLAVWCGHLAGTRERARAAACPGLVSSRVQRGAPARGTRADPAGRALRSIEPSLSVWAAPADRVVVRAHRTRRPRRRGSCSHRRLSPAVATSSACGRPP
jgi:hypothetical protein